jgi:hypothetical protein
MKEKIVFALIMGSITTGIVTFAVISVNFGFINGFLAFWLRSWALAYIVAIPAILLISPKVQLLANYLCRDKELIKKGT